VGVVVVVLVILGTLLPALPLAKAQYARLILIMLDMAVMEGGRLMVETPAQDLRVALLLLQQPLVAGV
jgi:hypothetical protein